MAIACTISLASLSTTKEALLSSHFLFFRLYTHKPRGPYIHALFLLSTKREKSAYLPLPSAFAILSSIQRKEASDLFRETIVPLPYTTNNSFCPSTISITLSFGILPTPSSAEYTSFVSGLRRYIALPFIYIHISLLDAIYICSGSPEIP